MKLFADADYPFIARRRIAYAASGFIIALGLAAMFWFSIRGEGWVNYGIDFEGGVLMQVQFQDQLTVEQLRIALSRTPVAEIARLGEGSEFIVRAPLSGDDGAETRDRITQELAAAYGTDRFEISRTELVGPKVGAELQQKAAMAITLSFLLTLIYLAFRFEPRFGLAAIIATLHDIVITMGFIAGFRIEVGIPTIAAILTVVGYSLNDTIVVFDRIREKLRKSRGRHEDESNLINRAINETLPRTILTSGTTVAVLLPLYLFGGVVLRDFAVVLLLGIVIGTYSSIFVASPALLAIRHWRGPARKVGASSRPAARGAVGPNQLASGPLPRPQRMRRVDSA